MPFRSAKQRAFLKWKHPDIFNRWKAEHGTKIVPTHRSASVPAQRTGSPEFAKSEELLRAKAARSREQAKWRKQHPDWSARMDEWMQMSAQERKAVQRRKSRKISPEDIKFDKPRIRRRKDRRWGIEVHKSMRLPNGKIVRFRTRRYTGGAFNPDEHSAMMGFPRGSFKSDPELARGADYVEARIKGKTVGQLKLRGKNPAPGGIYEGEKTGYIKDIEVKPKYRRKGIATGMYLHAERMGMEPRHSSALSSSGKKWRKAVGGPGNKVKGISNKRKIEDKMLSKAMMAPKLKPPSMPALRPTPMKPPMSRPGSMPTRRAAATRQTPGVKPPGLKTPTMPKPPGTAKPMLKPTGMTGRPMPNAKPTAPIPMAAKPPKPFGKADWRIGPATVDEDDKRYAYAGAGASGAGAGAFAARKQNAKPLPWTEARREAAAKIMSQPTGKTVQMDLATMRQFRRNPGVRINDYGHTVSLADAMRKGTKLPPVTVRIVEGKQPFIMDGMHRINAAHMIGLDSVPIRIEETTRPPRFRFPRIYNRKSLKMQQRVPRQLAEQEFSDFAFKKPKTPFGQWAMARNAKKGGKPWNATVPKVRFR